MRYLPARGTQDGEDFGAIVTDGHRHPPRVFTMTDKGLQGREDRGGSAIPPVYARAPAAHRQGGILLHPPQSRNPTQKEISIQDLLVWAYRDEMVHAAKAPGVPVELTRARLREWRADQMAEMMALGVNVDASVRLDFEAPVDAYRVDRAVACLGEAVGEIEAMYLPPVPVLSMDVNPSSAPVVERAVKARLGQLVFSAAVGDGAPDWITSPELRLSRGKCVMGRDWRPRRAGGAQQIALLQIVEWHGDAPWCVGAARARYALWWDALERLRAVLAGGLERFVLTNAMPLRRPWAQGA